MSEKRDNIYIYVWEEFNTIYIGRTINPKSRHYQHRHIQTEKTYQFSSEHHVEHPKMIIIENDLSVEEGIEREKYWIEHYRNNGEYIVLNKTSGGQIGSNSKTTLTEQEKIEHRKEYYEKNKEKINSYNKNYIKSHNEKILLIKRKYREKHRKELREKAKEYYNNNKEKMLLQQTKYREEHKEELKEKKKEYHNKNKEKMLLQQTKYREEHKEELKKYREEHKEELKKYMREYMRNKRKNVKS